MRIQILTKIHAYMRYRDGTIEKIYLGISTRAENNITDRIERVS